MFDGEMVKRNFPFEKKIWTNFWSKTMLDLENFHQNFILPKALKCHV